jgi:predicted metal-dependent phosphoesterase TrpH
MLIDLHAHTFPFSQDSYVNADDLVEKAKQTGLDGICLSEHDVLWDPDEVISLGKRHNFLVLPAIEVTSEDGHILCYGLKHFDRSFYRVPALRAAVSFDGAVCVGAHPFRRNIPWHVNTSEADMRQAIEKTAALPAYEFCSALERINGKATPRENAFSHVVSDLMRMPGTAGSDSHQISDMGKCATEFDRRIETVWDLMEELRAGRCRAVSLVSGLVGDIAELMQAT